MRERERDREKKREIYRNILTNFRIERVSTKLFSHAFPLITGWTNTQTYFLVTSYIGGENNIGAPKTEK